MGTAGLGRLSRGNRRRETRRRRNRPKGVLSPEFSRQDRQERKDELSHSIAPDGLGQNLPDTPPGGFREIPYMSCPPEADLRALRENCNVWAHPASDHQWPWPGDFSPIPTPLGRGQIERTWRASQQAKGGTGAHRRRLPRGDPRDPGVPCPAPQGGRATRGCRGACERAAGPGALQ